MYANAQCKKATFFTAMINPFILWLAFYEAIMGSRKHVYHFGYEIHKSNQLCLHCIVQMSYKNTKKLPNKCIQPYQDVWGCRSVGRYCVFTASQLYTTSAAIHPLSFSFHLPPLFLPYSISLSMFSRHFAIAKFRQPLGVTMISS